MLKILIELFDFTGEEYAVLLLIFVVMFGGCAFMLKAG